jgi:hypothetical protein
MGCSSLKQVPPEGLKPNLLKAMIPFSDEFFEGCSKPGELRSLPSLSLVTLISNTPPCLLVSLLL